MPPLCVNPRTSSFFTVYCRVRAATHSCCPAGITEADKPTAELRLKEPQTALPPSLFGSTNEQTNSLLKYAFEFPVDCLGHCSEAFQEGVGEIPDDALAAEEVRDVLMDFVDSMPMFQRIVQQWFAGALCP